MTEQPIVQEDTVSDTSSSTFNASALENTENMETVAENGNENLIDMNLEAGDVNDAQGWTK